MIENHSLIIPNYSKQSYEIRPHPAHVAPTSDQATTSFLGEILAPLTEGLINSSAEDNPDVDNDFIADLLQPLLTQTFLKGGAFKSLTQSVQKALEKA